MIAQIQHITYNEWLPIIVGRDKLGPNKLALQKHLFYSDYNMVKIISFFNQKKNSFFFKKTNPSALNEFTAAAGLFFFSLFPEQIGYINQNGYLNQVKKLSNLFNDPSQLYNYDQIDSILRYLIRQPTQNLKPFINSEFSEKLFRGFDKYGLDLSALIIQMGRDHGINGYIEWRNICGLSRPESFDDLKEILIDQFDIDKLKKVYVSVNDIDLFVIGLAERPINGALLGPTFSCIILNQFERVNYLQKKEVKIFVFLAKKW